MPVADVMVFKVVRVSPDDTVSVAIARMLEENVGSVGVCEGEKRVRIFTERDVRRLVGDGSQFADVRVGDVMTRQLVTLAPDDDILDAARLMGEREIRHLPVLADENLLGLVDV